MAGQISISTAYQDEQAVLQISLLDSKEDNALAFLLSNEGTILKQVHLQHGENSINLGALARQAVQVKVETGHETLLQKIEFTAST